MVSVSWLIWWVILLVQGMSFTWVSRARNSGSVSYATAAGIVSHGLWFATQAFIVVKIVEARADADGLMALVALCAFYVSAMVIGQSLAMVVLMRWLEVGKRKVGA